MYVLHAEADAARLRVLHQSQSNAALRCRVLSRRELHNRKWCPTRVIRDCARLLHEASITRIVQFLRLCAGRTQARSALELGEIFLDRSDAYARPSLPLRLRVGSIVRNLRWTLRILKNDTLVRIIKTKPLRDLIANSFECADQIVFVKRASSATNERNEVGLPLRSRDILQCARGCGALCSGATGTRSPR